MRANDTIAAPATPPAPAARAIVRTSGPRAFDLLATLSTGDRPALRSATGEDVVEYHLPGSPLFVKLLLGRLFDGGARLAEPGEFTAGAFFAGRLDLARAEGVAATIAAANRRELDAARKLLAGELNRRLAPAVDALVRLLASVEADLDFADEPVDAVGDSLVRDGIAAVDATLAALLRDAPRIERLSHEPRIVLTGRPNAGKSTLLNALAGGDRAVVSDVAGTTRDALSARVILRRGPVTLVDTAGVEIDATTDAIERQMRDVAFGEAARADAVVQVIAADDADAERADVDAVIWTKVDLVAAPAGRVVVSVRTGVGLDAVRERLDAIAFGVDATSAGVTVALNARHVDAIGRARDALADAAASVPHGREFVAGAIRRALDRLGDVGGAVTPDDILGRIFGSFCIGK